MTSCNFTRCNYTNAVLTGLLMSVYAYACGFLVWAVLFAETLQPLAGMYRDMQSPEWIYGLPLGYLVIGFALSFAFCAFGKSITCECNIQRGLKFGLVLFLISGLPCAIFSYALYPVPMAIAYAHLTEAALVFFGGGVILSLLCSKKAGECGASMGACDMPERNHCATAMPAKPSKKAVAKSPAKKPKKKSK